MENQYIVVITTVPNRTEAEKLAAALIKGRLVACVNISSPVISVYYWQGDVSEDEEYMLFMKTEKALYQKVEEEIKRLHSYELPEVIAIPIESGSREYFSWITENTSKS